MFPFGSNLLRRAAERQARRAQGPGQEVCIAEVMYFWYSSCATVLIKNAAEYENFKLPGLNTCWAFGRRSANLAHDTNTNYFNRIRSKTKMSTMT